MPVTIIHPPDCKCGRHADCPICLDSGYRTMAWDTRGFHGDPCSCKRGQKAREKEAKRG